jgi:hypothetical protein
MFQYTQTIKRHEQWVRIPLHNSESHSQPSQIVGQDQEVYEIKYLCPWILADLANCKTMFPQILVKYHRKLEKLHYHRGLSLSELLFFGYL